MPKIFFPSSRPRFIDREQIILKIKTVALRVAEKNKKVKAIYLFGSYAGGNAGLRSDADILVVLSEDERPMRDRLNEFIVGFINAPVPVDVLVYTQDELQEALAAGNRFLHRSVAGIKLV